VYGESSFWTRTEKSDERGSRQQSEPTAIRLRPEGLGLFLCPNKETTMAKGMRISKKQREADIENLMKGKRRKGGRKASRKSHERE